MFHSLMNATPLGGGGEEWQGRPLAALPEDPARVTPASLVSLVQRMQLTPADGAAVVTAAPETGV